MLHFFPSAFPDETLFGRMARYHRLSGHPDDRASLHELVGLHTHVITSDLPSSLQLLVDRIPLAARPAVADLIKTNTIFPYFKAFLPPSRSEQAIDAMAGESTSGLKMALGLVASRFGGKSVFRFCRACMEEDTAGFGQAYWHRVHQLPGAWVCLVHRQPLCELDNSAAQLKRHKLFLPDDPFVELNSRQIRLSANQIVAVLRVSRLSSEAMATEAFPGSWSSTELHRENAERNNLIDPNGRIRVSELANVLNTYSSSFPAFGEYSALHGRFLGWSLKLLRKPRGNALHPIKHILLLDCLRSDNCRPRISRTVTPCAAPRSSPDGDKDDRSRLIEMVEKQGFTLTRAAAELGLSVTTVRVEAERLGVVVRGRPKSLTDAVRLQVVGAIREGLALQEVAKNYHLSLVSVYRILRMNPALAVEYAERSFQDRRDAYRKRYANGSESKADYSWLRRNDKEWLDGQLARKKRIVKRKSAVDWSARDKFLAHQVLGISESMRSVEGKPKWVSRAALERRVSMAETIERNAEKLPMTHEALSTCAESREEYQRRRLRWAALHLLEHGSSSPPTWLLLRVAGIRVLAPGNAELIESLGFLQRII